MRKLIEELGEVGKLDEATEVERNELEPADLKKVKIFEKAVGGKSRQYFDGMSGMIVTMALKGKPTARVSKEDIGDLYRNARWIEIGYKGEISIGF